MSGLGRKFRNSHERKLFGLHPRFRFPGNNLATFPHAPLVISRDTLASLMDKERIPAQYLDRPEAFAWVARELRAKRLVFGTLARRGILCN
jgi:hypothetical protein